MANEKNLKPILTEREAREKGQNGGKASVKSRRKKKQMSEMLKYILALDVTDEKVKKKMGEMGIEEEQMTYNALMCYAMVGAATKGNVKAAVFVRDTIGEKPKEKEDKNTKEKQVSAFMKRIFDNLDDD